MILACDAGGTKTILALYDYDNDKLQEVKYEKFSSREYSSFQEIISEFLKDIKSPITAGVAGIAGPIVDGVCRSTNLSWGDLDERVIGKDTGIPRFKLVNDLVATASAVPFLKDGDLDVVHKGGADRVKERVFVIAPGTGLGNALLLYSEDGDFQVIPSEAGHVDFAPRNDLEAEMLSYLSKKYKRVSVERIASGLGIPNIYEFLVNSGYAKVTDAVLSELAPEGTDASAVISKHGMAGTDPVCAKAMELFVAVLAAHAGNMVLALTAQGGVYLGGGIPPKIAPLIHSENFISAYTAKGRLSYLVENTPVYMIKDSEAALHGAAHIARKLSLF